MTDAEWQQFLRRWNHDLFGSPIAAELPDDVKASRWIGRPPPSDSQISKTEERLGIALPPSYRAFLRVSNGWGRPTESILQLNAVDEVDWFRKANRDWIRAYTTPVSYHMNDALPDEDYFAYGENSVSFRITHLKETLQISEVGDSAVYLLNPQVITKEGEWEAWFFANWLPGARRYRSFEELMLAEYARFTRQELSPPAGAPGGLPDEYRGSPGSPKRRVLKRKRRREPKLLNKPLSKWTAEELLEILRNPEFGIIHGEAIHGLGLLGDARAVEPLIASLRAGVNAVDAAAALKRLDRDQLREELLEILANEWRSRIFHVIPFAALLAELRDERAVPILNEIMHDESPESRLASDYVGTFLGQLGHAGFDALAAALQCDSAVVRTRATRSLIYTNDARARDLLAPLERDPDPAIYDIVRIALQVLPPKRLKADQR